MNIEKKISNHNFKWFLWHAGFLALAQSFMDVDTVIPAMLVESGGGPVHIGIMTAIMTGGSSFTQLFFAPYLSNKPFKKYFLVAGINARIFSLVALGFILYYLSGEHSQNILFFIFLFISIFAFSGAFANISYIDIIGKSIDSNKRKRFFSSRQIIAGIAITASAILAKEIITAREFPINYSYSFFIGSALLLVASLGFWNIKESTPSHLKIGTLSHFFQIFKNEIKNNKKLLYLLGFINTQGVAISFLPFVLLYAKSHFDSQSTDTGYFLLFKIIGVVFVSVFVLLFSSKIKYKLLLHLNLLLSVSLALSVLMINDLLTLRFVFVIGGIIYSLYSISMNGVLLEVSGTENRALYAGFAGAGNILPAIFSLVGGWFIQQFGFSYFFVLFIAIVSSAIIFIRKLNCKK